MRSFPGDWCRRRNWRGGKAPALSLARHRAFITSYQNGFTKWLIKMFYQNISSICLIKMSHQNVFTNISSKCPIKMSHRNISSKCLLKMSHKNVFCKGLPFGYGLIRNAVKIPCIMQLTVDGYRYIFWKNCPSGPILSILRNVRPCVCPSVRPSVCLFTFEVPFKRLFAPTSWSWMSKISRD